MPGLNLLYDGMQARVTEKLVKIKNVVILKHSPCPVVGWELGNEPDLKNKDGAVQTRAGDARRVSTRRHPAPIIYYRTLVNFCYAVTMVSVNLPYVVRLFRGSSDEGDGDDSAFHAPPLSIVMSGRVAGEGAGEDANEEEYATGVDVSAL